MDPVSFVDSLKLKFPSTRSENDLLPGSSTPSKGFRDGEDEAKVVDGSVMAFTHNLTGQNKQDVMNGTLLAQLAANYKVDREEHADQWYKEYVNVLENIGFVIQQFDLERYESQGVTLEMDKVVLEILAAVCTGNGLVIATAAIDALGKLPGDDRSVVLFDNQTSQAKKGNFQIAVADVDDKSGDVIMGLGAFYFSADTQTTRFLWITWKSSSIDLFQGAEKVLLNEQIYGKVRQKIIDKLGDKAVDFVSDIPI